jgi:hypothetical protein
MKKARITSAQAKSRQEVLEEGDPAHQVGDGFEQRPGGVETGLRHLAGAHEVLHGKAGARSFEAEAGETLEDDLREVVPVGDQIGEDADEQRLLDEPRDDVVIGAPGPEQGGERYVDDDQRGGDEADLASEQAEAAVDVAGEDPEEVIDDTGAAHGSPPFARLRGGGRRRAAEEAVAGLGPDAKACGILGRCFTKLLAPALPFAQRIALGLEEASRGRSRCLALAGQFNHRRRDGDGDEHDRAEARQHLAVHDDAPANAQLPNISTVPGW